MRPGCQAVFLIAAFFASPALAQSEERYFQRMRPGCQAVFLIAAFFASPALAQSEERYFQGGYNCFGDAYITDWRISGDFAGGAIRIEAATRSAASDHTNDLVWNVQSGDLTRKSILNGPVNNNGGYIAFDLLGDHPAAQKHHYEGHPQSGCERFDLVPVPEARLRFSTLLERLSAPIQAPNDSLEARRLLVNLPPYTFLPVTQQEEMRTTVQATHADFQTRYQAAMRASATRLSSEESQEFFAALAQAWRDLPESSHAERRFQQDVLLEAGMARAAARYRAGEDPSQNRLAETEEFCGRLGKADRFANIDTYYALLSDLPAPFWTKAVAEDASTLSLSCEGGETFRKRLAKDWPEIEAMGQALARLEGWIAQVEAAPAELEAVAALNWLEPNARQDGFAELSGQLIDELTEPVIEYRRNQVTVGLLAALQAGMEHADVPVLDVPRYCRTALDGVRAYNSSLFDGVSSGCASAAAEVFATRASAEIETLAGALPTGLTDAKSLVVAILQSPDISTYRQAARQLNMPDALAAFDATLNATETRISVWRATAIQSAAAAIEAGYASPDPGLEAVEACAALPKFGSGDLALIARACNAGAQKAEAAACERDWSESGADGTLSSAMLLVPGLLSGPQRRSLHEIFCDARKQGADLRLVVDKGFFSTDYRLERNARWNEKNVTLSVRLDEPASQDGDWTLSEPELSSGRFADEAIKGNSADLLQCLFAIELCVLP